MGVVWQARDERLHRLVAVKQLLLGPDLGPGETEGARQRALREARIAARLHHPNAIVVYDVAEHDGEPCLVMEYLPSRSLAAVLAERGCLPVTEVASIGKQVASALAAAHAAQIVHRDVKPGNILITEGGTAKITDFGVSRASGDVTVTQTGMMAGTPAFLAPEVARGQTPTPASDVFSLGATLYAAVEGSGPFGDSENQLALLHKVAAGEVAPPQHAGSLTPTLMSLLAKDPDDRPDMRKASMELGAALSTRPIQISSAGRADRTEPQAAPPPPPRSEPPRAAAPPPPPIWQPPVAERHDERPAPRQQTRSPEERRKLAILVGSIVAVIALAGLGVVVALNSQGTQNPPSSQAAGSGTHGSIPSVTATPPPTTSAAPPPPPPPAPQNQPVRADGPIDWSSAGQLVINYYNGVSDPSSAWQMLSPGAQAAFGSEQQFQQYWSQFSSVSARNAFGVTENADGSVDVPVDVSYSGGSGNEATKRHLRVTSIGGRLFIDSDPR
jgi:serine/threonine protein kinase